MMPKLLLADDSITVQRVIALTFQGEGIDVIAVGDGDLAVEAIDRERPQIVLADLSMPGRDGYAVAEYVKGSPELARDIRVVLLTGAAEPVEEARSRALGIDGVLSKPFEPHVATALVRRLLAEAPTAPGNRGADTGAGDAAGASIGSPGDAPPPLPAAIGAAPDHAIAVDDYFRRLDEALATAGLSTAPESAADLAAITAPPPAARGGDAETMIVPRRVQAAPPAASRPDDADAPGDAPKLVDAFSALLAAEEGSAPVAAGPVDMDGPPAPVPQPAVEWTSGPASAPVEAAAETVAFQAVAAEAAREETPAQPEPAADEPAPADVAGEVMAPEAAPASAIGDEASRDEPVREDAAASAALPDGPAEGAGGAGAEAAATVMLVRPLQAVPSPAPPDAARTAVDGLDLDRLADAVAQKILHRLTDARIDAIVSERVVEIAERLVREEIERIKADAQ